MFLRTRYSVAAVAAALILTGCSAAAAPEAEPSVEGSTAAPSSAIEAPGATLGDAVSGCGLDGADGVKLDASAASVFIDTKGPREASGVAMEDVSCVLKALDVPKAITSMMKLTTSTAEPTNASWAGRDFSWNYDPETHFQLTIGQA